MRKSVLIMHGGAEREIMSLDRSKQAGRADWQFDLISTNGGLDEEKREEEEEVWMAATVWFFNISQHPNIFQAALGFLVFQGAVPCMCALVRCVFVLVCVQQTVCGCVPVVCQVGEDRVFNQSSLPPPNLIRSVRVAGLRGRQERSMRERGQRAGGGEGELNPNEKCLPCRPESNVWQQKSTRS